VKRHKLWATAPPRPRGHSANWNGQPSTRKDSKRDTKWCIGARNRWMQLFQYHIFHRLTHANIPEQYQNNSSTCSSLHLCLLFASSQS
jgi:hypothetical protein